jgi:hypothetical protein
MTGALLIFIASLLYASVGHAGASGYLAVMALIGTAPEAMRPTALVLNLIVASIGTRNFVGAGHFRWALFWPFAVASVPMAYLGGRLELPVAAYRAVVGVVLLVSALRFVVTLRSPDAEGGAPPRSVALATGAALGLLAGLTGVGGGIFLSPLLLMLGWASLRVTAATSVVFILVNSAAGLAGQLGTLEALPSELLPWSIAVVLGGSLGSWLGARRLASPTIRGVLAAVLLVAGLKLVLQG